MLPFVKRLALLSLCLTAFSLQTRADTLELRNGSLLKGTYAGGSQGTIRFDAMGNVQVIAVADVLALTFDARPAAGEQAPVASTPEAAAPATPAAAQAPSTGKAIQVPAGTPLLIKMKQGVNSKYNHPGYRFTALLEAPLQVGGTIVAPKGSTVYGQLTAAEAGGRVARRAEMSLVLTDIMIGELRHPIVTGAYEVVGERQGTGRKVVRGAAIGALIDGKKGARTGAKVGAGAAILTRGKQIDVPAGTLLEFRLTQSMSLGAQ